jgi:hypothetical protein
MQEVILLDPMLNLRQDRYDHVMLQVMLLLAMHKYKYDYRLSMMLDNDR